MTHSFRHLQRMTDDTGLLEHCLGLIPRRHEGYTTDDNARALWVCVEWSRYFASRLEAVTEAEREALEALERLTDVYLAFLLWGQRADGHFHNNIGYNRLPEPEHPSDDCLGRSMWACANAALYLPQPGKRRVAEAMFAKALPKSRSLVYPRGRSYALAACSLILREGKKAADSTVWPKLEGEARALIDVWERELVALYRQQARPGWRWFESLLTYGNGLLPWALFFAYEVTGRGETLTAARDSLDFLIEKMTAPEGWLRPIGNKGWCGPEHASQWDQQPLEVMKLALAASEAYRVLKTPVYRRVVERCRAWFLGENDHKTPLADPQDGSCCDALTPEGVNWNRGAESTLSYLLTEVIYLNAEVQAYVCAG